MHVNPPSIRNIAPNHVVVDLEGYSVLYSYETPVAILYEDGTIALGQKHDCSRTTARYRNQFLNCTRDDLLAGLDSGEITYFD